MNAPRATIATEFQSNPKAGVERLLVAANDNSAAIKDIIDNPEDNCDGSNEAYDYDDGTCCYHEPRFDSHGPCEDDAEYFHMMADNDNDGDLWDRFGGVA